MKTQKLYPKYSILYGMESLLVEFRHIPKPVRKKLIKLMARISEKSYRRGVHQSVSLKVKSDFPHKNIEKWRYANQEKSLGVGAACHFSSTMERFFEQNPEVSHIGIYENDS